MNLYQTFCKSYRFDSVIVVNSDPLDVWINPDAGDGTGYCSCLPRGQNPTCLGQLCREKQTISFICNIIVGKQVIKL